MSDLHSSKIAELSIIAWFLERGIEVYTPVADMHGTDAVVRIPRTREFVSVQVKHKRKGSKNEGQLGNPWHKGDAPFDFLVFYQPEKNRGVILPRRLLKREGKMLIFFDRDSTRYSNGDIRLLYRPFGFEFPIGADKAKAFVEKFLSVFESERQIAG